MLPHNYKYQISENVDSIYKSLHLSLKYFANICRRMITFELPVIPSDRTNQFKCMWMMKDIKLKNLNLGDRHVSIEEKFLICEL